MRSPLTSCTRARARAAPTKPTFRETRARYLADSGYATYDEALAALVRSDAAFDDAADGDEVVLWFEHDLFDQLQLLRVLARCARRGPGRAPLSLICIGAYPGVSRFDGLGQLSAAQLLGLFPGRRPVTRSQLDLAADGWRRFGLDDPRPFAALLDDDTSALPYLAGAVRRQLEELPSTRNGLSRTEHQALAAVAAGAGEVAMAFRSTQEMEERVFMGDLCFVHALRGLATTELPLVQLDPPGPFVPLARQAVVLTPFGREVLARPRGSRPRERNGSLGWRGLAARARRRVAMGRRRGDARRGDLISWSVALSVQQSCAATGQGVTDNG